jgi:hypothetical protein
MRQARIVRLAGSEGIPGNGPRVLASVPGRPQHRAYEAATEAASNPAGGRRAHVALYVGYCVKDREKVQFEGTVVELKNGRKAAQGICPKCGTKVMRILGKSDT